MKENQLLNIRANNDMPKQNMPKIEFYDGFSMIHSFQRFVTTGDLGGTKERLALYGQKEDGTVEKIIRVSWFGEDVSNINDILTQYDTILHDNQLKPSEDVVLGCAGLIEDNGRYCKFTNIELEISTPELEKIGLHTELINDFFANAQGIPYLKEIDKSEIPHKYKPESPKLNDSRTMIILGPGTGLGVAPIFWDEKKGYYSHPSEGGHKSYNPRNELEWSLCNYIKNKVTDGRVPDVETVASGKGLANIVDFLCYGHLPKDKKSKKIQKIKYLRKDDNFRDFVRTINKEQPQVAGRLIIEAYKNKRFHTILDYAVNIFVDAVASAARDTVHDFCSYGGVYISGGNARRLKDEFCTGRFMNIFDQSYVYTDKLRATPVYLVTSNTLGTDGAAHYAFNRNKD